MVIPDGYHELADKNFRKLKPPFFSNERRLHMSFSNQLSWLINSCIQDAFDMIQNGRCKQHAGDSY